MRITFLFLLLTLISSPGYTSPDQDEPPAAENEVNNQEKAEPLPVEDKDVVADLELLELYELLVNMNALASMEDTR